jgi:hypothetical protein
MLKWMHVLVCSDIVLTLTQDRCMVCAEHSIGSEIALDAPDDLLCDFGLVESCFNIFGDSGVLVQVTCTVCAKRTIGTEIILDAPDGTPR